MSSEGKMRGEGFRDLRSSDCLTHSFCLRQLSLTSLPLKPGPPWKPSSPVFPSGPCSPGEPREPLSPGYPGGPLLPECPVTPGLPGGPGKPGGPSIPLDPWKCKLKDSETHDKLDFENKIVEYQTNYGGIDHRNYTGLAFLGGEKLTSGPMPPSTPVFPCTP